MPDNNKTPNLEWANNIRFIATLTVVLFHVSGSALYSTHINVTKWYLGNLVFSFSQYCVPFFFLLSGALNLKNSYSNSVFFRKRIKRIFLPFLFWGIIFSLLIYFYQLKKGERITIGESVINFIFFKGVFRNYIYHFWFVYTLLIFYTITPLLKKTLPTIQKNKYFFIAMWLVSFIGYSFFHSYTVHLFFSFLLYLGYYILGYYLNERFVYDDKRRLLMFFAFLLITLFVSIIIYFNWYKHSHNVEINRLMITLSVAFSAIIFYRILKSITIKNNFYKSISAKTNLHSYGIYLVHAPVLFLMEKGGFDWQFIHPFIGIPLVTVVCFLISLLTISVGSKIKILTKFVG